MGRASALVALGCMLAVAGADEGRVCCHAVIASCEACKAGMSVEEYCADHPMVSGCPSPVSEMCPDSPPQVCRMQCEDPGCAADECAMREGNCCDLTCKPKNFEAPAPFEMCPDSPAQVCKMLCQNPGCAADECAMREGNCCDMKCKPKVPAPPTVCCEAMTAQCLSCKEDTDLDEYCQENPHTTGCEGACCKDKIKNGKPAGLNCMACFKGETKAEFCDHLLGLEKASAAWWQDIDSWLSAVKNREKKLKRKCKKYNDKNPREQLDITVSAGGESATAVRVHAHDDNAPVKCDVSKLSMASVATNVILAVVIVILAVVVCRGRQDQISAEVEREPSGSSSPSSPSSSPTAKMQPSPVV